VRIKIFYGLIALLIIPTGIVFAEGITIEVQTDDNNYDEGDIIVISGSVTPIVGETPVILQIIIEGNIVYVNQIKVAQDGSYSDTVIAEGQQWKNSGNYVVRASYGEGNSAETEFSFAEKTESIETTTVFDVDAGSLGTFDVEYTIKGGTVIDMIVDQDIFGMIIQIESTDEGTISLDLPREFIGAEKQNGKDEKFIILIKNIENTDEVDVDYKESVLNSDSRVITINFEEGDSDIIIIGTYVIPEFGTIAMMILIVGIMTIILVSRNKFQIKV